MSQHSWPRRNVTLHVTALILIRQLHHAPSSNLMRRAFSSASTSKLTESCVYEWFVALRRPSGSRGYLIYNLVADPRWCPCAMLLSLFQGLLCRSDAQFSSFGYIRLSRRETRFMVKTEEVHRDGSRSSTGDGPSEHATMPIPCS